MIRSYLKTGFRALGRNKIHALINVSGLVLGIASCILISLYVRHEWTFDHFHQKAERIFRVFGKENWGINQEFFYTVTPFPMGPALKDNLPEVQAQVRVNNMNAQVKAGASLFNERITLVGQDFFDVFDFQLVSGDKTTALRDATGIVITERMAVKYFGSESPIDKTLQVQLREGFESYTIKGVVKNPPTNSSIQFDFLFSDLLYSQLFDEQVLTSGWFNINPETYVLLREDAQAAAVEAKFPTLFRTLLGAEEFEKSKYAPGLQPLLSIHLDTSYPVGIAPVSNPRYTYILSVVALLILFVACVNFVTLSVGRSIKRAKEVGIRKVVGAQRRQLIMQFLSEALIITIISLVVGVVLARVCLPVFNSFANVPLAFSFDVFLTGVLVCLLCLIGLISGSYPALVLSAFQPVTILKGGGSTGNNRHRLRKALVGLQLVLAIFLISSTIVMRNQLNYLRQKDLGFNKNQLLVVRMNTSGGEGLAQRIQAGFQNAEKFKTEFGKIPGVKEVCAASHDFGNGAWTQIGYTDDKQVYRNLNLLVADADYAPSMQMQFTMGRNFERTSTSDARRSIIVNEALVKAYDWDNPLGMKLPGRNFGDHEIIGVIKDFNYSSLYTKVEPLVIVQDAGVILRGVENINIDSSPLPKLFIRLETENVNGVIRSLEQKWSSIVGGEEFVFSFVDQTLQRQYEADENLGRIISIATALAIFIGSLGLYGLASLALQSKVKEISIRKVMGATEQSLWLLLGKEYLLLVVICLLVSVPFTWWLMQEWLSSFEYRVQVSWQVFTLAGAIALTLALVTLSYELMKAAWAQPAKTLKHE